MQIARPGTQITNLRLFIGSVWLTVATTLFCALLPIGLPQTSSVGSAFNPSTTVVALRSVEPSSRLAQPVVVRPRNPDAGPIGSVVLPLVIAAILFIALAGIAPKRRRDQSLSVFAPSGAAYPRGPPSRS